MLNGFKRINLGPGRCNRFPFSLCVRKAVTLGRSFRLCQYIKCTVKKDFHTWILYLWQVEQSNDTKCKDIRLQKHKPLAGMFPYIRASFLTSTFFLLNSIFWLSLIVYSFNSLSDLQCSLSGRSINCWLCIGPTLNKIGEKITNGSGSNCEKILWQKSTRFNLNMVYKNILPLEL